MRRVQLCRRQGFAESASGSDGAIPSASPWLSGEAEGFGGFGASKDGDCCGVARDRDMLRVIRSAASATIEEAAAGSGMTLRAARRALSETIPRGVCHQTARAAAKLGVDARTVAVAHSKAPPPLSRVVELDRSPTVRVAAGGVAGWGARTSLEARLVARRYLARSAVSENAAVRRTRRDNPIKAPPGAWNVSVTPGHAGMTRHGASTRWRPPPVPRTRRDDPAEWLALGVVIRCSPHTQGRPVDPARLFVWRCRRCLSRAGASTRRCAPSRYARPL